MLTVDRQKCSGCGACIQKCPRQCISWCEGELGFQYPMINPAQCIGCGLCERVCPVGTAPVTPVRQTCYAVVHCNDAVLKRSTSGGAFSAIAEKILAQNGVVYGCSMEDGLQVKHIRVCEMRGLENLRGSKYVQSNVGCTYQQAETDLKAGRAVFYTGTPCQIAGLNRYLGRTYENLITADIVCHGVGSQKYFDRFVECLHERYGRVIDLQFRAKETAGWSCSGGLITVEDRHSQRICRKKLSDYDQYYYSYFLGGEIHRESCYTCPYANLNRPGDFTLGDFWGIEALKLPLKTEGGCSLLLVNSEKAQRLLEDIDCLQCEQVAVEKAVRRNQQLAVPSARPKQRDELAAQFAYMNGEQIDREYRKSNRVRRLKLYLKSLIPYQIKRRLRKLKG